MYSNNYGKNRCMGEFQLEDIGRSGGIIVIWGKRVWKEELVTKINQTVACKIEGINQAFTWFLSAVYVSYDPLIRRELLQEFVNIKEPLSILLRFECHKISKQKIATRIHLVRFLHIPLFLHCRETETVADFHQPNGH